MRETKSPISIKPLLSQVLFTPKVRRVLPDTSPYLRPICVLPTWEPGRDAHRQWRQGFQSLCPVHLTLPLLLPSRWSWAPHLPRPSRSPLHAKHYIPGGALRPHHTQPNALSLPCAICSQASGENRHWVDFSAITSPVLRAD